MVTLIAVLIAALLLSLGYHAWWESRHPPLEVDGLVRLRGRVAGERPGAPAVRRGAKQRQRFALQSPTTTHLVVMGQGIPLVGGSALRVGDGVTVDGLPSVEPAGETLYRQSAMTPCIDALRLTSGSWPRLRWLPLIPLAALLAIGTHHGWLKQQRRELVERAATYAANMGCPAGAEAVYGDDDYDFGFTCQLPGGARHGPYALWSWDGTLIERGEYHLGAPLQQAWLHGDTSEVMICPAKTPDMLAEVVGANCRFYEVR